MTGIDEGENERFDHHIGGIAETHAGIGISVFMQAISIPCSDYLTASPRNLGSSFGGHRHV